MDNGMSLQGALTAQHPGKYDFTGRVDGAKKLHLQELKQQRLTFAPVQPGEKPGAEAADAAVYGLSRKRAVIEVLRDGKGYGAFDTRWFCPPALSPPFSDHLPCGCAGAIYDEDEAMNARQILEEMQSSPGYYRSLLSSGDQLPESTTEVNQLLASCMQPLQSIQLGAPVDAVMVGRRKHFFLNQTVIDELPFLDVEDRLDLLPVSRQGSLADNAPSSSSMPLICQRSSSLESVSSARDADEDTMDEFLMAPCTLDDNLEEFNRNLALAISNSEVHTYGNGAYYPANAATYATDSNGAGPSGVSDS